MKNLLMILTLGTALLSGQCLIQEKASQKVLASESSEPTTLVTVTPKAAEGDAVNWSEYPYGNSTIYPWYIVSEADGNTCAKMPLTGINRFDVGVLKDLGSNLNAAGTYTISLDVKLSSVANANKASATVYANAAWADGWVGASFIANNLAMASDSSWTTLTATFYKAASTWTHLQIFYNVTDTSVPTDDNYILIDNIKFYGETYENNIDTLGNGDFSSFTEACTFAGGAATGWKNFYGDFGIGWSVARDGDNSYGVLPATFNGVTSATIFKDLGGMAAVGKYRVRMKLKLSEAAEATKANAWLYANYNYNDGYYPFNGISLASLSSTAWTEVSTQVNVTVAGTWAQFLTFYTIKAEGSGTDNCLYIDDIYFDRVLTGSENIDNFAGDTGDFEHFRAKFYARTFNSALSNTCDPSGNTNIDSLKAVWKEQSDAYALAVNMHPYFVSSTEGVKDCFDKYDYIVSKYSAFHSEINDFLGRSSSIVNPSIQSFANNENNSFILISVIAFSTFVLVGSLSFVIIRYKKHN